MLVVSWRLINCLLTFWFDWFYFLDSKALLWTFWSILLDSIWLKLDLNLIWEIFLFPNAKMTLFQLYPQITPLNSNKNLKSIKFKLKSQKNNCICIRHDINDLLHYFINTAFFHDFNIISTLLFSLSHVKKNCVS